jgi:hypothetical protein
VAERSGSRNCTGAEADGFATCVGCGKSPSLAAFPGSDAVDPRFDNLLGGRRISSKAVLGSGTPFSLQWRSRRRHEIQGLLLPSRAGGQTKEGRTPRRQAGVGQGVESAQLRRPSSRCVVEEEVQLNGKAAREGRGCLAGVQRRRRSAAKQGPEARINDGPRRNWRRGPTRPGGLRSRRTLAMELLQRWMQ